MTKKYLSKYFIGIFRGNIPEFEEMDIYVILSDSILISTNKNMQKLLNQIIKNLEMQDHKVEKSFYHCTYALLLQHLKFH